MADALLRYASSEPAAAESVVRSEIPPKLAFVLPGQGAQWIGMARELIAREPAFRDALQRCDNAARRFVDWSIMEQLAAAPGSDDFLPVAHRLHPARARRSGQSPMQSCCARWASNPTRWSGTAWRKVAAACIAGALDLDQAMQVVCARSALMRRLSGQGAMALVDLPMAEVETRLAGVKDTVSMAAANGPRSSVISGAPGKSLWSWPDWERTACSAAW